MQDAYSLRCTPQVLGAVCDAIALRGADDRRRAQRLDRQSARLRQRRRALRRQLPRPAGGAGARLPRDGRHHAAGDCRAPGGAAGESRPVAGAPRVPDGRPGAFVRLHDGADHGRVAGGGVPHPGPPGQHRVDPDRREPGGLRPDGDGGGLQGATDPRQRGARRRRGAAVRGAGARVPAAADAGPRRRPAPRPAPGAAPGGAAARGGPAARARSGAAGARRSGPGSSIPPRSPSLLPPSRLHIFPRCFAHKSKSKSCRRFPPSLAEPE